MGRGAPGNLLHRESCQVLEEQASSGGIKGNADNCKIAKIWGRVEGGDIEMLLRSLGG